MIEGEPGDRPGCIESHCCGKGVPLTATFDADVIETCQEKSITQFWHSNEYGSI